MPWPFILLICVVVLALALHFGLPGQRPQTPPDDTPARSPHQPVVRDDDRYWIASFLYNNPADPALFVPKRYKLGWTVNLGHPLGKLVLIGTLLVPLALILIGALTPR